MGGTGSGVYVASWGMAMTVLSAFADSLVYNSVWMIAMGILLGRWRVTLVGYEDAQTDDLTVDGPDDANTVWIGRRYASEFDARVALDALSKRIRPAP
jgi:hypothetical protein